MIKVTITNPLADVIPGDDAAVRVVYAESGVQGPPGPPGPPGAGVPNEPWAVHTWTDSPLVYAPGDTGIPWSGNSVGTMHYTRVGRTIHAQIALSFLSRRSDWQNAPIGLAVTELPAVPAGGSALRPLGFGMLAIAEGPSEVVFLVPQVVAGFLVFYRAGVHAGGVDGLWGGQSPADLTNRRFQLTASLTYEAEE